MEMHSIVRTNVTAKICNFDLSPPQGPVQFYIIPYPIPLYSKTDKGAIGSNTCHLPEAVTSVSHVRMTNNLHHFVQK